uniref:Peptidase S9A N-terminal domain-containing protein n=1 Tax=Cannabis sativa TaxID=3483 RepID=A0A803QGK0_CANSA
MFESLNCLFPYLANPPTPPKPPQKPQSFSFHDQTWEDPYSWMSSLNDKVAMCHMDIYMEQEEKSYYHRAKEGKQYSVLCRRLASLNEEFVSHKSPSAGFDFTSGRRIEQKLLDFNQEAERGERRMGRSYGGALRN